MRALRLCLALLVLATLSPAVAPSAGQLYTHYIGAVHEHSGYSDGWPGSRPADYYASAKEHGLDFLGSGEHSDNADLPSVFNEECLTPAIADCAVADKENPMDSFRKWDATLEQARAATDASFTGFRGFEWTSDRFGHLNVYFSRHDANAKIDGGYAVMETFWEWFLRRPELGGGSDGLMTFNHPNSKKLSDDDPTKNWNDFAYVPAADARVVGIEVYNTARDYGEWYPRALDKGWHVGAVGAEDLGHDRTDDWGAPRYAKTVLIANDRSEPALREAMLARRMYAVLDNGVRIAMNAGGEEMGARIGRPLGSTVPIVASVTPEAARLELVTNGGAIVASEGGTSIAYDATVTDSERYYFLRALDGSGKAIAYSSPVWIRPGLTFAGAGEWLAGDLHIHTTYSHDAWDPVADDNTGPDEFYTLGHSVESQFHVASSRGLDYLAITDHNDIRSQTDPGFGAFGVMPVHGYENSLSGHAQMLGARACYSPEGPFVPANVTPGTSCNSWPDRTAARVSQMADALRADGGVFQINHPLGDTIDYPTHMDWGYRYDVVPDTVEVWNISPLWQPPAPSGNDQESAIDYWEGWLDRGHKVGLTGGSDNHYLGTTVVQGAGQPTTWVFAQERSERGVLEALRAGRSYVSFQPPVLGGPGLFLEADADGDHRYEAMVGDTVPGDSGVAVRTDNAPPGSSVRIIYGGPPGGRKVIECDATVLDAPIIVNSTSCAVSVDPTQPFEATWVRAELVLPDLREERTAACDDLVGDETTYCRNRLLILAMTSAIYLS